MTEESIFDKVEKAEEPIKENSEEAVQQPIKETTKEDSSEENKKPDESALISDDFKVEINDKSAQEIEEETGKRVALEDGTIITIQSLEIKPPKTKQKKGDKIVSVPPKKSETSDSLSYSTKLAVKYEEDNLIEYYPGIRFWVNDGVVSQRASIYRDGNSKVSQMFKMALQKMSGGAFELKKQAVNERQTWVVTKETKDSYDKFSKLTSDAQILQWLVGKKVKIAVSTGIHEGKKWFRNDWAEIIE